MSKKNEDWIDIENDHSDEQPQIQTKMQNNSKENEPKIPELQKNESKYSNVSRTSKNTEQGKKFNMEEFRAQQLVKLNQIKNDQVWVFIFKNLKNDISQKIKNIPSIKCFEKQKGFDLKIKKEQAFKLLSEKNYLKLQLSRKNDPRPDQPDRDNRPRDNRDQREQRNNNDYKNNTDNKQKRKYVEKVVQQQKVEQTQQPNQYTYTKAKKNQDRQKKNQDRQKKPENYQNNRIKKQYKDKDYGLGNFRNKPKPEIQENKVETPVQNKQINSTVQTKINVVQKQPQTIQIVEKKVLSINETNLKQPQQTKIIKQEIKQIPEQKKSPIVVIETIKNQQKQKNGIQNGKTEKIEKKTYQNKKNYEEKKKPNKNNNKTRNDRQQERTRETKKKQEQPIKKPTNTTNKSKIGYNPFSNLDSDEQN